MPFLWDAGCTRQRRKTFLAWGPPVYGNFELATPNSVRGCTWARPTWRRMKKGAGVHCARANVLHLLPFPAPTGQTVGTADAKLTGHMYATPTYMLLLLPFLWDADCASQDRKTLFERGPPALGNLDLLTPNLVNKWNSMSVIRLHMSFRDRVHSARAMHVHYAYA